MGGRGYGVYFSRAVLFCQPHQHLYTHSLDTILDEWNNFCFGEWLWCWNHFFNKFVGEGLKLLETFCELGSFFKLLSLFQWHFVSWQIIIRVQRKWMRTDINTGNATGNILLHKATDLGKHLVSLLKHICVHCLCCCKMTELLEIV